MDDDRLNVLWLKGVSIGAIAAEARATRYTIAGRLRRLRAKDPAAWPVRPSPLHPNGGAGHRQRRAPQTTLPPLPSLSD